MASAGLRLSMTGLVAGSTQGRVQHFDLAYAQALAESRLVARSGLAHWTSEPDGT